jgi:Spy/CpxP family protein refolding chaperone
MIKQTLLVIASALMLSPLAIADRSMAETNATPSPAPASTMGTPATNSAPATTTKPSKTPSAVSEILNGLNLTPEQKPKVDNIQALADAQIKAILTPEQLKQLKVLADAGKADSEAFKSLNLSPEQKTKLNEVQLDVAQQLFTVLTEEQRNKLMESMMARTKSQ